MPTLSSMAGPVVQQWRQSWHHDNPGVSVTASGVIICRPGVSLYIKLLSYQHRHSHYEDKTVSRQSYLYNGNPIPGKFFLYWNGPSPQFYLYNWNPHTWKTCHYSDVIMSATAFQITDVSILYSTVCWGANQRKHQSSASLFFVKGIHRWFPSQRASNAENVFIGWRHHDIKTASGPTPYWSKRNESAKVMLWWCHYFTTTRALGHTEGLHRHGVIHIPVMSSI